MLRSEYGGGEGRAQRVDNALCRRGFRASRRLLCVRNGTLDLGVRGRKGIAAATDGALFAWWNQLIARALGYRRSRGPWHLLGVSKMNPQDQREPHPVERGRDLVASLQSLIDAARAAIARSRAVLMSLQAPPEKQDPKDK